MLIWLIHFYDVSFLFAKSHLARVHCTFLGRAGLISITLDSDWKESFNQHNPVDVEAAERAMQFKLGWFAHPIFVNGDYPQVMKDKVYDKSMAEGRNESRLPQFTEQEKAFISGKLR